MCEAGLCLRDAVYRTEATMQYRKKCHTIGKLNMSRAFFNVCKFHAPQGDLRTKWNTVKIEEA